MTPSHIEHIGIAVTNLDEAIRYWEDVMGLKCYAIEEVTDQKVKTAFFKIGEVKIELLEPTCPESTIAAFIEKNGGKGRLLCRKHRPGFERRQRERCPSYRPAEPRRCRRPPYRLPAPQEHPGCPHRVLLQIKHPMSFRVRQPAAKTARLTHVQ